MKKLLEKIAGVLLILAIAGYFLIFYPFIISPGEDGQPRCKSLIGLSVGC